MRKILRRLFITTIALAITAYLFSGLQYRQNVTTLLSAALTLTCLNLFIKPLLKLILLPLNLITMGLFRWAVNVIIVYLTTVIIPGFSIIAFSTPSFSIFNIRVPVLTLSQFWSLIFISFCLTLTTKLINFVISDA